MEQILINPSKDRRILDLRPLGFRDVVLVGRYRYASVRQGLDEHSHGNMIEICYLERGQQTYVVGNQQFDLCGGDVFVAYPGEKHGTGPSPEGKGVLYWVLVQMPSKRQRFLSLDPASGQRLTDSLRTMPARHFKAGDRIGKMLRRVFDAYDHDDHALRTIELQNLLLRFLLDLLDASRRSKQAITPRISGVQRFIDQHIDDTLTVRRLAAEAGLSETRFKSRFKQETGIPPAEYVLRKKIERAEAILRSSDVTVTQAAMRLSFSTSHYFATVFKRYTGRTPTEYRRQCHRKG